MVQRRDSGRLAYGRFGVGYKTTLVTMACWQPWTNLWAAAGGIGIITETVDNEINQLLRNFACIHHDVNLPYVSSAKQYTGPTPRLRQTCTMQTNLALHVTQLSVANTSSTKNWFKAFLAASDTSALSYYKTVFDLGSLLTSVISPQLNDWVRATYILHFDSRGCKH